MLTLEQIKALRGCSSNGASLQIEDKKNTAEALQNSTSTTVLDNSAKSTYVEPVDVPCKNYDDEDGHFAYIDANTKQPVHFNTLTGQPYTQDDINKLSLNHSLKKMPEVSLNLLWNDVITNDTLYDKFGSPVISEQEIRNALNSREQNTADVTQNNAEVEEAIKTDAFGFPL